MLHWLYSATINYISVWEIFSSGWSAPKIFEIRVATYKQKVSKTKYCFNCLPLILRSLEVEWQSLPPVEKCPNRSEEAERWVRWPSDCGEAAHPCKPTLCPSTSGSLLTPGPSDCCTEDEIDVSFSTWRPCLKNWSWHSSVELTRTVKLLSMAGMC